MYSRRDSRATLLVLDDNNLSMTQINQHYTSSKIIATTSQATLSLTTCWMYKDVKNLSRIFVNTEHM